MGRATWNGDRNRSKPVLLLMMVLVGLLTTGCLQATVSLNFDENDRVSGQALIVVPATGQESFRLHAPEGLADRVEITPYKAAGKSGSKLTFTDLSFDEVERLGKSLSRSDSRYRFTIERAGSLVTVRGSVDLTPLAQTDSSVLIEINTPGEVTTTNGEVNGGVLSWRPAPGEVTEISATFQFANNASASWFGWATLVGTLTLGVAVLVALLALIAHRRMRRDSASPRV